MDDLAGRAVIGRALRLDPTILATPAQARRGSGEDDLGGGGPTSPTSAEQQLPRPGPAKPLGNVVLVTGGARGIGAACALELVRQGANVALVDIANPQALKGVIDHPFASRTILRLQAAVCGTGVRVRTAVADTRRFDPIKVAVEKARATPLPDAECGALPASAKSISDARIRAGRLQVKF